MQFRVVTLKVEQDHKRWTGRQTLIRAETAVCSAPLHWAVEPDPVHALARGAHVAGHHADGILRRARHLGDGFMLASVGLPGTSGFVASS